MIDIHHHLLFGLDDGAQTLEDSVAMIKVAVQDGITHIVATPHANHRYTFSPELNAERLQAIKDAAAHSGAGEITLGLGCDFHLTYDNIEEAKRDPAKFSINGKGYLLVELPDEGVPTGLTETFYQLQIAGLTPILTHPERNITIQRNPDRMKNWIRGGLLLQVTAGSMMGRFGRRAQFLAQRFLADNWVHFIATDAHNINSRPPVMRQAREMIAQTYGTETAHRLCVDNPRAAFYGEPMPTQPNAIGVYEDLEPKKSWFSKLFSR